MRRVRLIRVYGFRGARALTKGGSISCPLSSSLQRTASAKILGSVQTSTQRNTCLILNTGPNSEAHSEYSRWRSWRFCAPKVQDVGGVISY